MARTSSLDRATWGTAFQVEPSPSRPDTSAASITSCSKAQMRSAETRPPSCPVPCTVGIGGPGQDGAPRDAGHLVVGPGPAEPVGLDVGLPGAEAGAGPGAQRAALEPVGAVVGPSVGVDVEGPVDPVLVVVAEDVVGADDHAGGAPRAQSGRHDLGEQLGPLRLLGRHWPTIFGPGAPVGYLAPVPEILEVELYRASAEPALGRLITRAWMVDSRYGRGGTTPATAPIGAGRARHSPPPGAAGS